MQVEKGSQLDSQGCPSPEQLEKIHRYSKGEIPGEDLYVFSLRLCDDAIDREGERFDTAALPVLGKLFLGKSGIYDHAWNSRNQVARIFDTEICREGAVSYLKAWAYTRRGGEQAGLIADIEAGIKKEVSVGCAMEETICSVCGQEYGSCGHRKGEIYDGECCHVILRKPVDAYEFSFVAVPAQREAGVLKGLTPGERSLKTLAQMGGAQKEYQQLCQAAELGKRYRRELEDQIVRLGLSLELGAEEGVLRSIAQTAATEALLGLREALEARLGEWLPGEMQLSSRVQENLETGYLI